MKSALLVVALLIGTTVCSIAQNTQPSNPLQSLSFLEGTWEAKAHGGQEVASNGTYTFGRELQDHVLTRHIVDVSSCKGPVTYNCKHEDVLYVYPAGDHLKGIYFDNEGHVIHYEIAIPSATRAVFISDATQPGPQFRLSYERKGDVMFGKFELRPPGQNEWRTYLEWSGSRR